MMRLNRYLAQAGIASRRRCDDLIVAGLVKVNGEVITRLGTVIDETSDVITFKGKKVVQEPDYVYILLNKPPAVITTVRDEYKRRTVLDLITLPERIYPVGRLDYETTGTLLLTNDGELSHRLLHPNYKVLKVYLALLDKKIRPVDLHHLQSGVELEGQVTQPCKMREIRVLNNQSLVEIELREGRYRQIRKMFELFHYTVEELDRISFGGLTAKGLKPGQWRYLTGEEIKRIKRLVSLDEPEHEAAE